MSSAHSVIAGVGSYLPDRVITNQELAEKIDTSHDWIVERTGIHKRHFAAADQGSSDMGTKAAINALAHAAMSAQDIDLIVVATTTPDCTFPSTATMIQRNLGNTTALAFDVSAACAGYLVALDVADGYIQSKKANKVLVIGAEKYSSILDMNDRSTCVLFGDGAGAVVLASKEGHSSTITQGKSGILSINLQSDGRHFDILHADGGVSTSGGAGKLRMSGREVFKHAVEKMQASALEMLQNNHIDPKEIDWLIPHQANARIIESVRKRLGIPPEKVILTVNDHANTSSASIPLALDNAVRSGKIKKGDLILHEAIGGGLVWGSALLRY